MGATGPATAARGARVNPIVAGDGASPTKPWAERASQTGANRRLSEDRSRAAMSRDGEAVPGSPGTGAYARPRATPAHAGHLRQIASG